MTGRISFQGFNNTEVIPTTAAILVALAKDPDLYNRVMSMAPTQAQLEEIHERYKASFNEVLTGNTEKTEECDSHRKELDRKFSRFANLVKLMAEEDPDLLARAGIVPPKPKKHNSSAPLGIPTNLKVWHGEAHGTMYGKVKSVKRARGYELEVCEGDPSNADNWQYKAVSAKSSRMLIGGLIPGRVYWFRVRAIGPGAPGPWSSMVSLMAI